MKFGELAVQEAEGAVMVHTLRAGERVIKKGKVLRRDELEALAAAGISRVIAAVLEPGDIAEDAAAERLARALAGAGTRLDPAKTGRCNVFAAHGGLCRIDAPEIARVNDVDECITVATIAAETAVRAGDMVATIKIIPFSVPEALLEAAARQDGADIAKVADVRVPDPWNRNQTVRIPDHAFSVRDPDVKDSVRLPDSVPSVRNPDDGHWPDQPAIGPVVVHPWLGKRAALVLTRFAETHASLLDKAEAAQRERMGRCGGELVERRTVEHRTGAVTQALAELVAKGLDPILMLGASAIMDRRDVIPSAIHAVGGEILRFGMPVDPGNLLLLARVPGPAGPVTVIGVPSCARSLKRSGFDWVLERCCAGLEISSRDIAALGVGGLLDEIELRPAPRRPLPAAPAGAGTLQEQDPMEPAAPARQIAAVVLAAGLGSRMERGGAAKLLAELGGKPMVRWAVEAALASSAREVVVVTGHRADEVAAALAGLPIRLVHNPAFADGMASSLRAGIGAVASADAAVVCLGDMPRVTGGHIDRLIAAFDPSAAPIVVPTHQRKRGNPVLWARRFFAEIEALRGDVGARALLERHAEVVTLLDLDDPAVLLDVDTPAALAELRLPAAEG